MLLRVSVVATSNVSIVTFHIAVQLKIYLYHVVQTDPWFNFIANCWLFEAFSYHMVTLKIVYLIPVILSLVLQLPRALCEIGEEQREYQLGL